MVLERRDGFKPDHRSFGKFILTEEARKPALEVAAKVAALAAKTAPRSKRVRPGKTGHMADKFKVGKDEYTAKNGNTRAGAVVSNDDPAAAPNEFGGPRNKKHRMLGRAGAAFGEFRGAE